MTFNALLSRLAIILLLAGSAFAQTGTVTGTISDANHNLYANGTASAASVVPTGKASTTTGPVPTNANGTFSIVLPINVSYIFTVCATPVPIGPLANTVPKQVCFSGPPILIVGSQDISAQMNPSAPLLGPGGGTGGGGGGTVTSVNANSLAPLFTTTVTNTTTTPLIAFSLSNVSPGAIFGNLTASSGPPSFTSFNVTGTKCYLFSGTSQGCDIPVGSFPGAGWTYVDPVLTAGGTAQLNLLSAPATTGFQLPTASGANPTLGGGLAFDTSTKHTIDSDGVQTHIMIHKDDVSVSPTSNGLLYQTANTGAPPSLFTTILTGSAGDITVTNGDAQAGPPTITSATTGVAAGTYTCTNITVNSVGKITSADNGICNAGNTQSANLVNGNLPSANGPNSIQDSGIGGNGGVLTFFGPTSGNISFTPSSTASTLTMAGTNTPTLVLPTGSTSSVSVGTAPTTGIYFANNSLNYGFTGTNVFSAGVNAIQCNGTCNWGALSFTQGQTFQSGLDGTTLGSAGGGAVFRSANIISGATTASATGTATFQSGDNAATGGAVQTVGNATFTAGGFTGASGAATAWIPGYTIMGQKYWKDTTATVGTLACITTAGTNGQMPKVGTCTATSNIPWIGIISSTLGQSVFVVEAGNVPNAVSNASQTDTAGFFVCTDSSNAGDIVVQSTPCAIGSVVGWIEKTGSGGTSHSVHVINPVVTGAGGGGGVSSFTGDGALITNSASTGAVTVSLHSALAHTYWGNNTGSTATPAYVSIAAGDLPLALQNGTTATTQSSFAGDTKLATDNYVDLQTKPIYSNATTGLTLSASTGVLTGVTGTGCTSGVCTMTTPGADGTYRFSVQVITTTAGVNCTAGTIQVQLGWTDADSASTFTPQPVNFHTVNSNSVNTFNLSPGTTAVGAGTNWISYPVGDFRAKASNAIKYQVNQTVAEAGCSTTPVVAVRVALYGPLGY